MSLFSKKRKASTEEFCKEFYDQYVFAPEISGSDPWQLFCETNYRLIAEADPSFRRTDLTLFMSELRAVRLEIFSLAWQHYLKDKYAPSQSHFTKHYLEVLSDEDIWSSMETYNQAIARSTDGGHDPSTRSGRAHRVMMNELRMGKFKEWQNMGYDPVVVARAANRLGSGPAWKSRRVHTYISFALTDQLQCEITEEARYGIIATIQGFYDGSSESLRTVKIVA